MQVDDPLHKPSLSIRAFNASICATVTAWNATECLNRFISGGRTILFFGISGLTLLAADLQGIDVAGFISQHVGQQVSHEDIEVMLCVGGVLLRLISRTPAFERWRHGRVDATPESAAGGLDEPPDTDPK